MPRTPKQPARSEPDPADQCWSELVLAARRFHALAPWRWMADRHVFGVLDPATGEVGWCCVLGLAGEVEGLILYRGDEGLEFHRKVQEREILEDEGVFGQEALVFAFAERGELSVQDRKRLQRLGMTFSGRAEWPDLQSHGTGRLPRAPDELEVVRMREALDQATLMGARVREDDSLLEPDAEGRLLVRIKAGAAGQEEWVDARREPQRPVPPPIPPFDRIRAERLGRSLPSTDQD